MDIRQTAAMAWRNLAASKLRFAQTLLGMSIGIAAVIIILTFASIQSFLFTGYGSEYAPGLLQMQIQTSVELPARVTAADMERLAAANPEVIRGVSTIIFIDYEDSVRYEGKSADYYTSLYGVDIGYLDMIPGMYLREGRWLEHMDISRERKVCVVGDKIADDLLGGDALGKELKIWGVNYTVVGVLDTDREVATHEVVVFIPYTNARKMLGEPYDKYNSTLYMEQFYVWANGRDNMYEAQVLVRELLRERTGREERSGWYLGAYAVDETMEMISGYLVASTMQYLLYAGIVLLIGGVGVMNVMLVSLDERTKEIGIRKAFGATNTAIKRQFALEAVIISLLGSLLGMVAGFIGACIICVVGEISMSFVRLAILPILAAVAVSILIGLVFGTYPANQAAKLEPVAAINSD